MLVKHLVLDSRVQDEPQRAESDRGGQQGEELQKVLGVTLEEESKVAP